MILRRLAIFASFIASTVMADKGAPAAVTYKAEITEIPGTGSGVTGTAVVFVHDDSSTVIGYGGFAAGLETNLLAATCNATNGCGVHVHAGKSCENTTAPAGHYYVDPITDDPWTEERYNSSDTGTANFFGVVDIGTNDLEGRAFLVHAENGDRLGCGLLTRVPTDELLSTKTEPLTETGVTGDGTVIQLDGERVCYFGSATNLEPDLLSFLQGGNDCLAENGCGAHVHSGVSCENATTQEGHFYNKDKLDVDPWLYMGYVTTDADGSAYYMGCLETGETEYDGRTFLVHANDGSRVSCGILAVPDEMEITSSANQPVVLKMTTALLVGAAYFVASL